MRQHEQYKNTVSSRIINIAMTAVAIGIASILIAMACSKGLQNEIRNKTSAFNGHILITLFENNESQVSILPFENSQEIKNKIEAHNNFDRMHAIALKAGMLKANDDFEGILLKGVDSGFKWTSIEGFLTQGDFPAYGSNSSNEILMSEVIANRLNLKVGDTVDAFFQNNLNEGLPKRRKFKIVGLFFSGFPDIDENLVYADLRQVQRLNQWNENQIGGYEVFVKSFSQVSQTSNQLYAGLPSELNSISISDRFSSIFQWITLFDFNVLIILIVMLLVGVINMATALLVLILERSRMVGLLKAIGAPDSMIQKIFMYNGIVIMSKGMFYGNLIGFTFYYSQLQWGWISLDPATYFVSVAPVSLHGLRRYFLT